MSDAASPSWVFFVMWYVYSSFFRAFDCVQVRTDRTSSPARRTTTAVVPSAASPSLNVSGGKERYIHTKNYPDTVISLLIQFSISYSVKCFLIRPRSLYIYDILYHVLSLCIKDNIYSRIRSKNVFYTHMVWSDTDLLILWILLYKIFSEQCRSRKKSVLECNVLREAIESESLRPQTEEKTPPVKKAI